MLAQTLSLCFSAKKLNLTGAVSIAFCAPGWYSKLLLKLDTNFSTILVKILTIKIHFKDLLLNLTKQKGYKAIIYLTV